jgi:hypothetical protein
MDGQIASEIGSNVESNLATSNETARFIASSRRLLVAAAAILTAGVVARKRLVRVSQAQRSVALARAAAADTCISHSKCDDVGLA